MNDDLRLVAQGWRAENRQLMKRVSDLRNEDLGLAAPSHYMPIWAILSHIANTRIYWLCSILGEPRPVPTPYSDASGYGWEDHLDEPRSKAEVLGALEESWRVVERWLDGWTATRADASFDRPTAQGVERHSHHSVLVRMMTHEAYHAGEISLVLGMNGLAAIDLWREVDAGLAPF